MSGNIQNIYSAAFARCRQLEEIVWPDGLGYIFNDAFNGCHSLTSVTLPNTVCKISTAAFSSCTNLTSITLSSNLEEIGQYAFIGCTSLQSITIPSSVRRIYDCAFTKCSSLRTIYFTGNMPQFTDKDLSFPGSFGGISDVTVYYPSGNRTWTASKVQALNNMYAASNIVFVASGSQSPEQPTDPDSTTGETGSVTPGETPTGTPEQVEPTDVPAVPTEPIGETPSTEQETVQNPTGSPEVTDATNPEAPDDPKVPDATTPTGDPQGEDSPKTVLWIAIGASAAAIAIGAVMAILLKKSKGKAA